MKVENKIPQILLIERLSKRLNYPITNAHFAVLMHGWTKKRPDQAPPFSTLAMRKKKDGFTWLTTREVEDLSRYAGYDLSYD